MIRGVENEPSLIHTTLATDNHTNKQVDCPRNETLNCLPVVVIVSEQTTSGHINVLLLFLLLLLLLLSSSGSRGGGGSSNGGSSSTCESPAPNTRTRSTQDVEDILAVAVGSEHSRPVGSNGVARGLHEVVEVLLLRRHNRTQCPTVISTLASARVRVAREMMSSSFSIVDIPSNMGMFNDHLHIGYNPPSQPQFRLHSTSSHQIASKPTESD